MLTIDKEREESEVEIIHSDNWDLPVMNLGSGKYLWRPKTAFLCYDLFEGPAMTRRTHGINLEKDLLIGVHGPRGSTKTLSVSYLLARKLRMGQPVWANFPISFYVIEADCWDKCQRRWACPRCKSGHKTYYENSPLNMDKLYTFNSEISEGAVGLTELQYYAESRASSRSQNVFLSYQLMQIRKSALSFFYDVQNPRWADNRFSWSDDVKIFCQDLSKMNYDFASIGHELQEGEYSHWMIRDISGVLTGRAYEETQTEYGPYQFDGYHFWDIFPTRWKIDVYDAGYSMKQKSSRKDKEAAVGQAMAEAINSFLGENKTWVQAKDIWARASALGKITISPEVGGKFLASYNVPKKQNSQGKYEYNLSVLAVEQEGAEVK